jgi:hypothetical protein
VEVGLAVEVCFEDLEGGTLIHFKPSR